MFFLMSNKPGKSKKKRKKGLETQRQETPKNEQGKTKNIFNLIYGCSYVIKRKHTPKNKKKETKIQRQTKTGNQKNKQRIDEKRNIVIQ